MYLGDSPLFLEPPLGGKKSDIAPQNEFGPYITDRHKSCRKNSNHPRSNMNKTSRPESSKIFPAVLDIFAESIRESVVTFMVYVIVERNAEQCIV